MFHFNGNKERQPVTGNTAPIQQEVAQNPETAAMDKRNAEIEAQRQAFAAKNPDFDMQAEMKNPAFINYIWGNGLSIEDAYFLIHREEILESARNEATNALLARQTRVLENGAAKNRPAIAKKNPSNLSDKEIDAIIERAKNGETITF
ncbi:MAG: hypothetical protein IJB80_00440 [Clostridia bacterium]|nr:hypothetical protein [Clostridia bacterium]